jgi:hypothetical protein
MKKGAYKILKVNWWWMVNGEWWMVNGE